tara:strand:- start:15234 stop:15689 length:456 start_codon:yes stop_codon:yes gene_type:complete
MAVNINKFDLNKNQAIGIAFPLLNEGSFIQTFTSKQQVKNNIINVLLTEQGERVNQPDLGVGLKGLLFENITNAASLIPVIEGQLERYVPDIELYDVQSEFNEDQHILHITLIYSIIGTNEEDSIKVNINGTGEESDYTNSFDLEASAGGY